MLRRDSGGYSLGAGEYYHDHVGGGQKPIYKYHNPYNPVSTNGSSNTTTTNNNNNEDSTSSSSMIGSVLGAIFCFLLFLLIIFALSYPFTMYRTNPYYSVYSNDRWWCYHCFETRCANRCWYSNGM